MSLIEVGPGQVELVVGGPGALAPSARLFDWSRADEYEAAFTVEIAADGVRARRESVTVTVWDNLGDFFDGLARDFRGWEGEQAWINNHLVVAATFGSGGHVYLSWTLRSGFFPEDWKCTVTNVIEAGEGMTVLAADVRAFLGQG
ncbi:MULTISPECIES: DUF6228 family protein [unclassified Streptomyces]|uniref:DUF6228 family protein n=1 Tax=unclassified Streptomyces TaxID=2593676 RepID=UPI002E219303|nr:DUF6228 family protein [Streptomyces sp. NBC_01023]WSV01301.1 DUF6228 family protein [Streptomyces sp. NBC_01023]